MIRGFTCGTFDLLHAGHIIMLRDCKDQCDFLIVGIQTDPTIDRKDKNKPVQSILERQIQVRACKYVDTTIVYETEEDLENILATMNLQKRFIGKDWECKKITGGEVCAKRGIEIIYTDRLHNWSSSELRKRIKRSK